MTTKTFKIICVELVGCLVLIFYSNDDFLIISLKFKLISINTFSMCVFIENNTNHPYSSFGHHQLFKNIIPKMYFGSLSLQSVSIVNKFRLFQIKGWESNSEFRSPDEVRPPSFLLLVYIKRGGSSINRVNCSSHNVAWGERECVVHLYSHVMVVWSL